MGHRKYKLQVSCDPGKGSPTVFTAWFVGENLEAVLPVMLQRLLPTALDALREAPLAVESLSWELSWPHLTPRGILAGMLEEAFAKACGVLPILPEDEAALSKNPFQPKGDGSQEDRTSPPVVIDQVKKAARKTKGA